jgi:signal transduction histidine kinase/ligand-binding sensor domain-containing protein/DNA-binding response OmpR family regulator
MGSEYTHIFRHHQVKDGLSDNLVTAFLQDKHGFMWIGTRDGLNRFDGYSFKIYRDEHSKYHLLNNSRINHISCDTNKHVWISTQLGIYKYDEVKDSFNILPSTQGKNIGFFEFDSKNNLWRLENGQLIRHNISDDTYITYPRQDSLNNVAFCVRFDDTVWTSDSQNYISLLNQEDGNFTSYNISPDMSSGISKKIYQLYSSEYTPDIYIAYESDNLKVFNTSTLQFKELDIQNKNNAPILINCILEINTNETWIGTDSGIFIYKKDRNEWSTILHDPLDIYGISSHYVAELYQDREKGIWIGYHQNGMSYYSPFNPFDVYYPKNNTTSLKGGVVHDICADNYGSIWVATEDAGISSLNKATGIFTNHYSESKQQNLAHTNIRGMTVIKDKLWIGHVIHGIDLLDVKTGKRIKNYNLYKDANTHVNSRVSTMTALKNGDLLVATTDGIYFYDTSSDKFVLAMTLSTGMLREDNYNRLWAGSYYCDLNNNEKITELIFRKFEIPEFNQFDRYNITDVYTDKDGDIWLLISDRGIAKYSTRDKRITWFTTKNGMPSNVVFRILPDDKDNLWVSTSAGLVYINTSDNSMTTYTEANGLITRQFNYFAGYKDSDGSLYFGTVKGLIHFDPNKLKLNKTITKVFVTSVYISEEEKYISKDIFSGKQQLVLDYDQSTFNINFSTLSYIAPTSTQYTYRMIETNKEWNNIGKRNTIYFTDLHPGEYTLEIKASDIYGYWIDSEPLFLSIVIKSSWWASNTAYVVYSLLAICMIFFIVRYLLFRQTTSMIYKMQLFENNIEKELYRAKFDFFINIAHEIRTPLTLIKVPLEKIIKYGKICSQGYKSLIFIEKNVSRLVELINQLLDFRKAEIEGGSLTYTDVEIGSLIQTVAERFQEEIKGKNIIFTINILEENFHVHIDREAFIKILSNMFSNAIKYTFSQIIVSIYISDDKEFFIIDFINDGQQISKEDQKKIFEPFYRIKDADLKPGTGLGLPLIRSLIEKHHGSIQVTESTSEKTIFRITTPIKQTNVIGSMYEKSFSPIPVIHDYPHEINRATILVVEDNEEMKSLISLELSNKYNVVAAKNGNDALALLKENNIQLIITDVLMPIMDGLELLKKIKTDLEYSHIPVILLTAKTTIQERLEGLGLGADAYIDKPFSMDILLAQILNLLSNRENIRQFYFKYPIANMKTMVYSKADEEFSEKLHTIINEHLSDPNFDVNTIAGMLFMSRPTLYRKIRAISNLTPHDLIKIARLKRAAELLIQGQLKIYEISELVGFSSQSYFWSAFIKQFGMSPSKYAKMNKPQ